MATHEYVETLPSFSPLVDDSQATRSRFFQIEVTTVCNFRCFYCIGRSWRPMHMKMELFESILRVLPQGNHQVSLQGEGEPLTHPHFWEMTTHVIEAGFKPYTITNGSLVDPERMAALFPTVGFSIDTIDPLEAERIGRRHLYRVLQRFEALFLRMGPGRVIVHSVDFGQDLGPLRAFLARLGVERHIVQPLQSKQDYRKRYPDRQLSNVIGRPRGPCRYLTNSATRFFNVDGLSLPCPFIKDVANYISDEHLCSQFVVGRVPEVCLGCRAIARQRS